MACRTSFLSRQRDVIACFSFGACIVYTKFLRKPFLEVYILYCQRVPFYPTALKGCRGIVFTHGVRMGGRPGGRAGGRAAGKSLSGLYLRNRKV